MGWLCEIIQQGPHVVVLLVVLLSAVGLMWWRHTGIAIAFGGVPFLFALFALVGKWLC